MEIQFEIAIAIVAVTLLRVGWILLRPLPHDVENAIMYGLRRIGEVMRGKARVEGNAPYGILWYGVNVPIAKVVRYNGRSWMISLALIDSIFLWFSQTLGILGFATYVFIGTFQLIRAPWNVSIDWIILLGPISWLFLALAPVAKLPVGLPFHAFGDTGRGVFYQHNYIYYGLLGTLWLIVFFYLYENAILDLSISIFGIGWAVLLGYLLLRKKR